MARAERAPADPDRERPGHGRSRSTRGLALDADRPARHGPAYPRDPGEPLQFQLTGHDDYGSGTTLATTGANVAGTRELVTLLRPLLAPRYTGLPAVYTWLDRLQTLIGQAKGPNGAWLSVFALSLSQRQQIDAAAGQALEQLAPIATITEPRRT